MSSMLLWHHALGRNEIAPELDLTFSLWKQKTGRIAELRTCLSPRSHQSPTPSRLFHIAGSAQPFNSTYPKSTHPACSLNIQPASSKALQGRPAFPRNTRKSCKAMLARKFLRARALVQVSIALFAHLSGQQVLPSHKPALALGPGLARLLDSLEKARRMHVL